MNGTKEYYDSDDEAEAVEEVEAQSPTEPSTPISPRVLDTTRNAALSNGADDHLRDGPSESGNPELSIIEQALSGPEQQAKDSVETQASSAKKAQSLHVEEPDVRLARLSEEREALKLELAEVRRSLEALQEKHKTDIKEVQLQLDDTRSKKEQAETQHRNLLGKVNTIRSQLGDRLKADAVSQLPMHHKLSFYV